MKRIYTIIFSLFLIWSVTYGQTRTAGTGDGCSINTVTVATTPANRSRLQVGVCEEVTIMASANINDVVTWSITGGGTLDQTSGISVLFTAPERAASPTISASINGNTCHVTFDVIEPTHIILTKYSEENGGPGVSAVRMTAFVKIYPIAHSSKY